MEGLSSVFNKDNITIAVIIILLCVVVYFILTKPVSLSELPKTSGVNSSIDDYDVEREVNLIIQMQS